MQPATFTLGAQSHPTRQAHAVAERRGSVIGFIIGTLCLVGFFVLLKRGRRHGRGRRRIWFRRLFRDLRATPKQREVVETSADRVRDAAFALRARTDEVVDGAATLFRASDFDVESARRLLDGQLAEIDRLRDVLIGAVADVHGALDPDQRTRLARHLERMTSRHRNRRGPPPASPYRSSEIAI
jgi:hypothetical protein